MGRPTPDERATRSPHRTVPPNRPDPRPMRVVYGASALAALSGLTVGLSHPKPPTDLAEVNFDTSLAAQPAQAAAPIEVRHVINYIHLLPGQTAPPGATVITPDAPAPLIVVTTLPAPPIIAPQPAQTQPKRRVKTRQSGTP